MLREFILFTSVLAHVATASCISGKGRGLVRRQEDFRDERCDTVASYDDFAKWSKMRYEEERSTVRAGNRTIVEPRSTTTIETWFHVIASSNNPGDGMLSVAQLDSQLAAMNQYYANTGFQFRKGGYTRTVNASWALRGADAEKEYKPRLRQGTWQTLNVYFMTRYKASTDAPGGRCPNPTNTENDDLALPLDGCTIHYATVPGGGARHVNGRMDMGKTAVHEVGHWLGLWHTFESHGNSNGGCEPGDFVDDTPAQKEQSTSCVPRDTCTDSPGMDPYTNFMDYSPDDCMTEFSAGQTQRMHDTWTKFRVGQ